MGNENPKVVISLLGTDRDRNPKDKPEGEPQKEWRPAIALCKQNDFHVKRLELIYSTGFEELAEDVKREILKASPSTKVNLYKIDVTGSQPWDMVMMYEKLSAFAHNYQYNPHEEYFIHLTTGTDIAKVCIFLLTERDVFPSAKLIHTKPPSREEIDRSTGSYRIIDLKDPRYNPITLRAPKDPIDILKGGLETKNGDYNDMIHRINRVAINSNEPVVLMGPTGSGKTEHARRIHELRKQCEQLNENAPLIEVNCATIRGDLAKSELFGHIKGAFTGATDNRDGKLLQADGGILFLDEIGELGLDEQAMLLTAIEEKKFYPMGSDKEVKSNFQLIAGTNRDLQIMISDGRFREDLFARINLWIFRLPRLRERPEDIEPNIDRQLEIVGLDLKKMIRFEDQARQRYLEFACSDDALWTGNFRDLIGSVKRMAILSTGAWIEVNVVEEEIKQLQDRWRVPRRADDAEGDDLFRQVEENGKHNVIDLIQLAEVLKICRKSRTLKEAGEKLYNHPNEKTHQNPSSSLQKYLQKFELKMEPGGVIKIIDSQNKKSK